MKRISPNKLNGPRAYFTDFDHEIIKRTKNKKLLEKNIERKLKVLLLTKSNIVCAASHLKSDFAYKFFKKNNILLEENLIYPALRNDVENIEYYLKRDNKDNLKSKSQFYNNNMVSPQKG